MFVFLSQVHHPSGQNRRGHAEEGGRDHGDPLGPRQGVEVGEVHPAFPGDPAEDSGRPAPPHAVRLRVRARHHLHRVLRQLLLRGEGPADGWAGSKFRSASGGQLSGQGPNFSLVFACWLFSASDDRFFSSLWFEYSEFGLIWRPFLS